MVKPVHADQTGPGSLVLLDSVSLRNQKALARYGAQSAVHGSDGIYPSAASWFSWTQEASGQPRPYVRGQELSSEREKKCGPNQRAGLGGQ